MEYFFILTSFSFYLFPILLLRLFETELRSLLLIAYIGVLLFLDRVHMLVGDSLIAQSEILTKRYPLILYLTLHV